MGEMFSLVSDLPQKDFTIKKKKKTKNSFASSWFIDSFQKTLKCGYIGSL